MECGFDPHLPHHQARAWSQTRSGPFALPWICAHIQSRSKLIILPMRGRPRLCVKQSRGLSLLICAMLIRNGVMAEKFSAHDAALMFSNSFKLLYSRRFPLILTGFPCMLRALALPGSLEKDKRSCFHMIENIPSRLGKHATGPPFSCAENHCLHRNKMVRRRIFEGISSADSIPCFQTYSTSPPPCLSFFSAGKSLPCSPNLFGAAMDPRYGLCPSAPDTFCLLEN